MNQEPFHISAQEWRYHSRDKSLLHSLHLAQLPEGMNVAGESVLIEPTAASNGRFSGAGVPPLQLPSAPNINATLFNTFNQFVSSNVYGCVGTDQSILARKNCTIVIDSWTSALMKVTMTVNKRGKYLVHIECQTDLRTLGYQGPANDGQCVGNIAIDGGTSSTSNMRVYMNGAGWDASIYVESIGHTSKTFISQVNGTVVFQGVNLGDPAAAIPAHISCFIALLDAS